jgi:hypothetical protein
MKVEIRIKLDPDDLTRPKDMDEAFRLIGGSTLPEEQQKPFARIRGNDFTIADVDLALAIVRTKAKELIESSRGECPFPPIGNGENIKSWEIGLKSTAQLATLKAERFARSLRDELAQLQVGQS